MLELIKVIADKLIPTIPWGAIRERKRDQRLARIGTTLFRFYGALIRICANGEAIVRDAEYALKRAERKGPNLDDTIVDDLYYKVTAQGQAVVDLAASAYDLSLMLELVAPDVFETVAPLIEGKASALQQLAVALSGSYSGWVGQTTPQLPPQHEYRRPDPPQLTGDRLASFQCELAETHEIVIALRAQRGILRPEQVPMLRRFADGQPRERLKSLRAAATGLREHIVQHFDVDDLLLEVADRDLVAGKSFTVLGQRGRRGAAP